MITTLSRLGSRAAIAALALVTLFSALPALASSDTYRWDWDADWLRQTNGGFAYEYPYDATTFFYTLPSRSKSFALHPYHRRTYYQYYHELPPVPGFVPRTTENSMRDCLNYSFSRFSRVPPYGYQCQE